MVGSKGMERAVILVVVMTSLVVAGSTALKGDQLARLEDERPKALDFRLETIDGEGFLLSELKGKAVVVDLMATWCQECRRQMPVLKGVHEDMSADLDIVTVDVDWYETDEQLRAFRDELELPWRVALDKQASVYGAFFPEGLPTLVVIDKDGRVAARHTGEISEQDLRGLLDKV